MSELDHAREALEQVCARGDLQRARELYAEDFVDHVNALDFHGQDGIARSVALHRAIFPDLEIRVVDQTADGDPRHLTLDAARHPPQPPRDTAGHHHQPL